MAKGRGTIKPREMETIFRKLLIKRLECDHHVRGFLEIDGKKVLALHYSFGRKDIYGRVLRNIMRDLHASEEVFFGLIDCDVDAGTYINMLRAKSVV
jgi:hypothetical protein